MQQMLLGSGGKPPAKYYIDDVFSMDPYYGKTAYPYNVLGHTITTNVNIKDDGGFVWIKTRESTAENLWFSPLMGVGKNITPASAAAMVTQGNRITQYKTDGFKLASDQSVNHTDKKVMSWSFKNNKGFFSHVEWTGNGTARTISHDLGCKPGFIAVKSISQGGNWTVWHRGMNKGVTPHNYYQRLNVGGGLQTDYDPFTAEPTATGFAIIADNSNDYEAYMNKSGEDYMAWVWAGGASDAATAKSVEFDGSDDQLNIPDSADWDLGNGDFTLETWVKSTQTTSGYFTALGQWTTHTSPDYGWAIRYASQDIGTGWSFFYSTNGSNYITTMGSDISDGQWHHIAITRTGGKLRTFTDGILNTTRSTTDTFTTSGTTMKIGGQDTSGNYFDGQLSNVRLVKGTALYTSSFRPPTEPLTNVTNTVLLCCNSSSVTGSTVTPGTITASSSPTASTDSPFDDPGNFIFGPDGDQNIIKTGYYIGNGDSTNGLEVELGFEPQFLWIKADGTTSDANYNWLVFDTMRTMDNRKHDNTHDSGRLYSSNNGAEVDTDDGINVLPTGFKIQGNSDDRNGDGHQYIYIAIRASEGYVSKVPTAGSEVFAMDTGNGSTTDPTFDSGFVVDFGLMRSLGSDNWAAHSRLMGKYWLTVDSASSQYSTNGSKFDSAVGMLKTGNGSSVYGWMWKRHAGFDCVAVKPGATGDHIPHNLGRVPEMIWAKDRGQNAEWSVYHKGLNGGTNPEQYRLKFTDEAVQDTTNAWNDEAPTSTHFSVGSWLATNEMMFMLFASTDVSHVGYYSGDNSGQTITTGFQPRFIIIRNTAGYEWFVFDTVRGWSQNNQDWFLRLDASYAQSDHVNDRPDDIGHPLSTGFYLKGDTNNDLAATNKTGNSYIYYCHA